MKPQIPWLRVFVEGVVIVGSILLAFGIQAGWEHRQEDILVRNGLTGVLAELDAVGADLKINLPLTQAVLSQAEALQALIDSVGEGQTLAVPDTMLAGLFWDYVSDPPTGMVESFISSRHLDDVGSDDLRRSLLSWIALLQDQRDDQTRASSYGSSELQPYLRAEFDVVRAQLADVGLVERDLGTHIRTNSRSAFYSVRPTLSASPSARWASSL